MTERRKPTLDEMRDAWDSFGEHPSARKVAERLMDRGFIANYTTVARTAKEHDWPHRSPPPPRFQKGKMKKPQGGRPTKKAEVRDAVAALADDLVIDRAYLTGLRQMCPEALQAEMRMQVLVATTVLAKAVTNIAVTAPAALALKPDAVGKLHGALIEAATDLGGTTKAAAPAGEAAPAPPAQAEPLNSTVANFDAFLRARSRPAGNGA
jgi:hypothetical protein